MVEFNEKLKTNQRCFREEIFETRKMILMLDIFKLMQDKEKNYFYGMLANARKEIKNKGLKKEKSKHVEECHKTAKLVSKNNEFRKQVITKINTAESIISLS